jgi:hypothetical protein
VREGEGIDFFVHDVLPFVLLPNLAGYSVWCSPCLGASERLSIFCISIILFSSFPEQPTNISRRWTNEPTSSFSSILQSKYITSSAQEVHEKWYSEEDNIKFQREMMNDLVKCAAMMEDGCRVAFKPS